MSNTLPRAYRTLLIALVSLHIAQASPLELRFSLKMGSEPLEWGKTYSTPAGNPITLEMVKFYVSNAALVTANGNEVPLEGIWLLNFPKNQAPTLSIQTNAPVGDYKGLRFSVGVPRALNHADPQEAKLPLGFDSGMFWSWNPGYIFYRLEGFTQVAGKRTPFLLHLGGDAYALEVNLSDLITNKIRFKIADTRADPGNTILKINLNIAAAFDKGPNGGPWDLSKREFQTMDSGKNIGQAYVNMQNAFKLE